MVERSCPELYEDLPVAGHRIRGVLVPEDLGASVLVDADSFHGAGILA
jgi:hypothetical protein